MRELKLGSFFEHCMGKLFERSGFKVKNNFRGYDHEIDVLAKKKGFIIATECKDRKGYLNLKSLIHEWNSKRNSLKLDRMVIAISGIANKSDKKFAKSFNITLWDFDFCVSYILCIQNIK